MSFQDKTLTCQDCGQAFTFSAEDQEYFAQKGYTNEPKRCPTCRAARRTDRGSSSFSHGYRQTSREMYPAICAQCGKETQVPFQPRGDRPVYCSDCYTRPTTRSRRY
ncbi:MAG: zinc-ribbon domain containing protein [Chloroflexi bacterium]|nr:zinc-ribbon domain containing protein [Chloroflexota bacterium]